MSTTPAPISAATAVPLPVPHVPIPKNGVDYRGKVVLAPMVRSGELPSRLLALDYGADLVWGPETVDRSMIGTTRRINPRTSCIEWSRVSSNGGRQSPNDRESILYRIDPSREKGKLIFQIGTAKAETAVEAAKLVAGDVSGIDVNSGCPKPFSTSGGMGAALLKDPDRLVSILEALVEQVGKVWEIGISVKIRLLETPEMTEELVRRLCATGITGLTVHCRTTPMRPRERAIRQELRMIADICREAGVACLMNGDVYNRDLAFDLMKEYNVDGAMIATAAESNSSAFRSKEHGGLAPWREVVAKYVELALSVENKFGNTKFLLSQLIPGKNPIYQTVNRQKCYKGVVEVLELTELAARASEVDNILGLGTEQKRKVESIAKEDKERKRAKASMEAYQYPSMETTGQVALTA